MPTVKPLTEDAVPYQKASQKSGLGQIIFDFIMSGKDTLAWEESEILQYGKKDGEQSFNTRKNILVGSIRRSLKNQHHIPEGLIYEIYEDIVRKEVYLTKVLA